MQCAKATQPRSRAAYENKEACYLWKLEDARGKHHSREGSQEDEEQAIS
jgi:hypothetical protein